MSSDETTAPPTPKKGRAPPWRLWIGVTLGLTMFLFILLEGGVSLLLLTRDLFKSELELAEARSTIHDPELGWVAIPNLDLPDFYGPDRDLRTESHGFRNSYDVTEESSRDQVRIVCSGDSFTLGYGVGNEDTWCHLLSGLLDVETVNMGQGGYGVDQAYLWYARDGAKLDHQVHIFAFIELDFVRTQESDLFGVPRPLLEVAGGELTVTNLPVPPPSRLLRAQRSIRPAIEGLRLMRLLSALRRRVGAEDNVVPDERNARTVEMLAVMFERLARQNEEKSSHLVLVNLPTKGMHLWTEDSYWQRAVSQLADSLGIPLIDLTPRLQELPGSSVERLFIHADSIPFRAAGGHYTAAGNRWAADALQAELMRIDALSGVLPAAGGDGG